VVVVIAVELSPMDFFHQELMIGYLIDSCSWVLMAVCFWGRLLQFLGTKQCQICWKESKCAESYPQGFILHVTTGMISSPVSEWLFLINDTGS
jgi:hypothetical protein